MALSGLTGKAVVTGGAGFIGSNLVARLVQEGLRVTVLDNLATGKLANLEHVRPDIDFIEGDITNPDTCLAALDGTNYVWHLAALGSVPRSVRDPAASNLANVVGTLNVLNAAKDAGARRVVFASSSSVYGREAELPQRPGARPRPSSPYAVTKLAGEEYMRVFWRCYGLETVSLRYFNVYGPQQDPYSDYAAVIPSFTSRLLSGQPGQIQGDGEQSRDFTYISDCLQATIKAMTAGPAPGNVYNVACGRQATINELYQIICRTLDVNLEPEYTEEREGDVRHSLADIDTAVSDLGYSPEYNLEQGLQASLPWYIEQCSRV
jgi:nucleoside-diphosphate-sugar epimerase